MLSNGITLVAAGLAAVSGVSAYSPSRAIHSELAKRADGDVQLHKRYSGTRWTFFDVGLGACGKVNVESDFIVALNADQFGSGYPGPNCEKTITMTYNGKTATAKIMDRCPGCPFGGLDLSRSLFRYFASESVGVISGDWNFGDSPASPAPAPETTSKKIATPVSKPTPSSSKAPAPVATTSTQPAVVTPAPAAARTTSSSVHVAQATPSTSRPARVAPSPSPSPSDAAAPAPAAPSHNANANHDKPRTSVQLPQIAAVSRPAPAPTSSTPASSPSSTAAASSSTAKATKSAARASPTSSKAASTKASSSTSASASASPSPSPTDPATLMENNLETIVTIISRLKDLLKKLRLEKD